MDILIREPDVIAKEFNVRVQGLIIRLEKKSHSEIEIANLNRLKQRLRLLKNTLGETELISEASPFFIEYSDQILARDEQFFTTLDVRAEYIKRKGTLNKQDEFIFSLTDSIKSHYIKSSQCEKNEIYAEVKLLLKYSVEYQLMK